MLLVREQDKLSLVVRTKTCLFTALFDSVNTTSHAVLCRRVNAVTAYELGPCVIKWCVFMHWYAEGSWVTHFTQC